MSDAIDDPLHDAIARVVDHPPHGGEPAADRRFTAAVMGRIAGVPAPGARRARPVWWLAAALVAVAVVAVPVDPAVWFLGSADAPTPAAEVVPAAGDDADGIGGLLGPLGDPGFLIEAALGVVSISAAALALHAHAGRRSDLQPSLVQP
jgi:hypothetical protein